MPLFGLSVAVATPPPRRLRNLWTPYAEFYHHESASRGAENTPAKQARFKQEIDYMTETWGDLLQNDPAYNPNLTLVGEDFTRASLPRTRKPWSDHHLVAAAGA